MCVCFGYPCAQNFKLRDYFERLLCWLDHWLSCMLDCIHICVFLLSKNYFEKLARHLLDTSPIPCYLPSFSSLFLIAILTPPRYLVDRSRMLLPPRHLVDRSSFCSWIWFFVARYLFNISVVDDQFLDTYLDSFLDISRYLICRELLKVLFKPPSWSVSHFFDLSRPVRAYSSPKHSLLHSQPFPQDFFKLFQIFLHLVSF